LAVKPPALEGKLQGENQALVFVEASLLAKGGAQRVLPRSKIRLQACLLQGKTTGLVFVGASLLAKGGAQRVLPRSKIRLQASSYKGKTRFWFL
jgi:hypothetical protein